MPQHSRAPARHAVQELGSITTLGCSSGPEHAGPGVPPCSAAHHRPHCVQQAQRPRVGHLVTRIYGAWCAGCAAAARLGVPARARRRARRGRVPRRAAAAATGRGRRAVRCALLRRGRLRCSRRGSCCLLGGVASKHARLGQCLQTVLPASPYLAPASCSRAHAEELAAIALLGSALTAAPLAMAAPRARERAWAGGPLLLFAQCSGHKLVQCRLLCSAAARARRARAEELAAAAPAAPALAAAAVDVAAARAGDAGWAGWALPLAAGLLAAAVPTPAPHVWLRVPCLAPRRPPHAPPALFACEVAVAPFGQAARLSACCRPRARAPRAPFPRPKHRCRRPRRLRSRVAAGALQVGR